MALAWLESGIVHVTVARPSSRFIASSAAIDSAQILARISHAAPKFIDSPPQSIAAESPTTTYPQRKSSARPQRNQTTWPTLPVDVADSVIEVVETGVGAIVEAAEDLVVEVRNLRRRSGSPLPNWAVSSRPERSRAWNKSTCTLSRSRNTRLSIGSCPSSRMKS